MLLFSSPYGIRDLIQKKILSGGGRLHRPRRGWAKFRLRSEFDPFTDIELKKYQRVFLKRAKKAKRIALCHGRGIGGTSMMVTSALHAALTKPNQVVVISNYRGSMNKPLFIQRLAQIAPLEIITKLTRDHLSFSNGSCIISMHIRDAKDFRAATHLMIDDAAFVGDDKLKEVLAEKRDIKTMLVSACNPTSPREFNRILSGEVDGWEACIIPCSQAEMDAERLEHFRLNLGETSYLIECECKVDKYLYASLDQYIQSGTA